MSAAWKLTPMGGLSPRVRGNLLSISQPVGVRGSIPARAGEPLQCARMAAPIRVYPRACGGTRACTSSTSKMLGLSPRVRGNPVIRPNDERRYRSIPARAGEPAPAAHPCGDTAVYPRACGGTGVKPYGVKIIRGLSPRVRGNLRRPLCPVGSWRSIPARAGEPHVCQLFPIRMSVYPRACGGTRSILDEDGNLAGLSPRVRGNRVVQANIGQKARSIPARAGEPEIPAIPGRVRTVYPRACGGTNCDGPASRRCTGLSPRVRGNRFRW